MTGHVRKKYEHLIEVGSIHKDPLQLSIVEALDEVYDYVHASSFRKIFLNKTKGLYIFGSVGSGKTFLMDIFFQEAYVPKKRYHYHVFIQQLYQLIHDENWINALSHFYQEAHVLCLDEFQLTDIGDSMLLYRFFNEYFKRGGILITTANSIPTEFELNKERALGKLTSLIFEHCSFIPMVSEKDYREPHHKNISPSFVSFSAQSLFQSPVGVKYYTQLLSEYNEIEICEMFPLDDSLQNEVVRFISFVDLAYERDTKLFFRKGTFPSYSGTKYKHIFKRTDSRLKAIAS